MIYYITKINSIKAESSNAKKWMRRVLDESIKQEFLYRFCSTDWIRYQMVSSATQWFLSKIEMSSIIVILILTSQGDLLIKKMTVWFEVTFWLHNSLFQLSEGLKLQKLHMLFEPVLWIVPLMFKTIQTNSETGSTT